MTIAATAQQPVSGERWPEPANRLGLEIVGHVLDPVFSRLRRHSLARPLANPPEDVALPVVVAGWFRTANGIGEGARSTYRALRDEGRNPIAVDLSGAFDLVDMTCPFALSPMPQDDAGTLIVHLNSPELPKALYELGMRRGRSWYVIGYWAWELPVFPTGWDRNFDLVSEIWSPSSFVTDALASHPNAPPVITKGHPIHVPSDIDGSRAQFGLPDHATIYLTLADSLSSLDRKNPFGAIDAFKQAFGDNPSKLLIVKVRNLARNERAERDIKAAIGGAPNIMVMDGSLSDGQRWGLLKTIDCLISLHRAEGFGMPLAEAIALGQPVIATAWSGTMDFCNEGNAQLVDYDLVPCVDRYGRYNVPDAVWAEPRIDPRALLLAVGSE